MKSGYCQLVFWSIAEKVFIGATIDMFILFADIAKRLLALKNEQNAYSFCSALLIMFQYFIKKVDELSFKTPFALIAHWQVQKIFLAIGSLIVAAGPSTADLQDFLTGQPFDVY